MKLLLHVIAAVLLISAVGCQRQVMEGSRTAGSNLVQVFRVNGVITRMGPNTNTVIVKHEAVPGYMPAMTMPFHTKDPALIAGLRPGDAITFQLHVTKTNSWIDSITSTLSGSALPPPAPAAVPATPRPSPGLSDIPDFALTNELGERVSLRQFRGQAVALTFFFTRCPIPEFCPRLSRSLAETSEILRTRADAPSNWHLISISFDPTDRPEVLRAYARQYNYDPKHWSFLTGAPADIRTLTRGFGLAVTPDGAAGFNHDFRTIIFDARGQFQTMWPFGGDTAQLLVHELIKAARAKDS